MAYQDPGTGSGQDGGTTTEVAKDQAGRVGQSATQAGGEVAQTAKDQVQNVVGEAKQQARDLVGEARGQVSGQAGAQKGRAVEGLRAIGDELDQMAQSGGSGIATEVTRQVSGRTRDLADYLDRHEPADLLEAVRSYARRRPVVFLAGATLAGVLAGRLTKGLTASDGDSDATRQLSGGQPMPAYQDTSYQETSYQQTPYEGAGTGYAGTGYESGGYQQPDYQPGYQPATAQGGFRAPDEAGYPNGGQTEGQYDPGYDPQQPPARGWTP